MRGEEEHGSTDPPVLLFDKVSIAFDDIVVLNEVSFCVGPRQMKILLGASGSGKSVILKLVLGLLKPDAGAIFVRGERIDTMSERELMRIRADIGMLFQESALFDSLSVADNVGYRLAEETHLPADDVRARVEEVLGFIGLGEYIDRLPSELSGGQRRRVAIARAIAARASFILFDEPVSGLDPITATTVDDEIIKLRDLEHVTAVVVTHQLRDAFYIATHEATRERDRIRIVPATPEKAAQARFVMLKDGGIHFEGTAAELRASRDPYLRKFLS
jgi:phospholipid/cholesterol/gamma-HCH transport system ATP-binding protein